MSVSLISVPINALTNVLISASRNDNNTKVIGQSPRSFYHGFISTTKFLHLTRLFYILGSFWPEHRQNIARTWPEHSVRRQSLNRSCSIFKLEQHVRLRSLPRSRRPAVSALLGPTLRIHRSDATAMQAHCVHSVLSRWRESLWLLQQRLPSVSCTLCGVDSE